MGKHGDAGGGGGELILQALHVTETTDQRRLDESLAWKLV